MNAAVTVRAPAKINLQLAVGDLRDDGFHDLVTVFHAVSLVDDVTASPQPHDDGSVTVEVHGLAADRVPLDGTNLAVRAARLLAERAGVDAGVHLRIDKGIPVAGGMAGGSADAAAALVACDALWHTGSSRDELHELAAELGSDVPFALVGGTAVGRGRGERLTPALARGSYGWVLAIAPTGLSTPAVYGELDRLRAGRTGSAGRGTPATPQTPAPTVAEELLRALRRGDADALGPLLANDLQVPACSLDPRLERTLEIGLDAGALGAVVCGSGPTVAFLTADGDLALDVESALRTGGTAADVLRAHGPVPGARIVEPVRARRQEPAWPTS